MTVHVFVGRLQIFTVAHLGMIVNVSKQSSNGNVVIVLGSAQESDTPGNPFSADEREAMLKPTLKNAGISAEILRINDVGNYQKWANKLVEIIGTKDFIIYGGENSSALDACRGIGIQTVVLPPLYQDSRFPSKRLSAGYVRELICDDNPEWKRWVPKEIVEYLTREDEYGVTGINKIKRTHTMDLRDIIEKRTGKNYRTPKDVAIFAMNDARQKEGVIRQMQLMCVAQYIASGKVSYDDIEASADEKAELQKLI